eukprot:944431-Prorocentrum_minimum.AAC.2
MRASRGEPRFYLSELSRAPARKAVCQSQFVARKKSRARWGEQRCALADDKARHGHYTLVRPLYHWRIQISPQL